MQLLEFSIPFDSELNYLVNIHTFLKTAKKSDSSLSYRINLRLKERTLSGCDAVVINRRNVILNNTRFHNVMDELLLETSKVQDELVLDINPSGSIRRIRNMKAIRKKWDEIKTGVYSAYRGDTVKQFLAPMEKIIDSEESFIAALSRDPFYRFFPDIYGEYGEYGRTDNNKLYREGYVSDFITVKQAKYKVRETGRLTRLESGGYEIMTAIDIDKAHMELIKNQLSALYATDGIPEVSMQCRHVLSSDKQITSVNSSQKLLWNEDLQKSITMQINKC
ncbi:MAG: hypothetical protein LBK94_12640 [Prevotellaceae bacterium]|jgi:hypothetical protein|nr:hypothetical protein [Prevotellaceae bacterium]